LSNAFDETAKLAVRSATPADVPAILAFVQGLAAYERLSHEVKASEADLARDLFGDSPKVFCDIAEQDGEAVGFALWYYTYSTFAGRHGIYLEDLFVTEPARGTGAGLALIRRLAARCAEEQLSRLDWAVLDWNALALNFYDALGATPPPPQGWLSRRLTGEALAALARSAP
jgi:GNAT superfamily N-acetyltransferase